MKTPSFLFFFAIVMGAYFFADFNTLYGLYPEGGSAVSALAKGILISIAVMLLISKARSFLKIEGNFAMLLIGAAGVFGYIHEAGKEQREGRKLLARYLSSDLADDARIYFKEANRWGDAPVMIEFTRANMDQKTLFPNMRKIPFCNIQFPNSKEFLEKMSNEELRKANFYWGMKKDADGANVYYTVLALLPDDHNWFFQTKKIPQKEIPNPEVIENARVPTENGGYVDRSCAQAPYHFHKRAYNSARLIRSEWDEKKDDSEKFNEVVFDHAGNPLTGQVSDVYVYFVEKEEEFQKGFGKAGMLKCVGEYTYRNGKKHGPYTFYYPGRVARAFTGQFENGTQVGIQRQYNPNGTLKQSWDWGSGPKATEVAR